LRCLSLAREKTHEIYTGERNDAPHEMYKTLQMMGMTKLNWSRNSAMNCRELPDGNPDFFRNSEEFLGLPNLCMFVIVCMYCKVLYYNAM